MTCREKLKKECPESVSKDYFGGCHGCPQDYGYKVTGGCAAGRHPDLNKACTQCWDQEALEVEPEVLEPENIKPARRATVYVSGPITGVEKYWEAFERAEDELTARDWTVLTPSRHPTGLTNAQYTRMALAMIDSADAVFFLPGWDKSEGARLERLYCEYIDKPHADSLDTFGEVSTR